ncbi:MAG TPA: GWxTD domain-containing protein [Thermoanaerobaculia bacterium]|nr:GWxTD domain-containing protein [Thermoanaerobaculia bacterium]
MRPSEFDRRYPGYRLFSAEVPEHSSWEPAARYLATPAELDAWKAPIGEEARERFLDEFWTRRDPTPKTEENEFRSSFDARVAFADRAFAGPQGERGSLTERGRALVLLGKPREVMFEKISSSSEAEIWGYDRVKSWRQVWKTNFSASVARVHFRSSRHTGNPRWTSGLPEIAKVGFPDLTPTFRLRLVETGRRTLSENGVNCAGRPIVAQVARLKRDLEG